MESTGLYIKLPVELMERLRRRTVKSPDVMAPSLSQVVRYGIELALADLARKEQDSAEEAR